MKNPKKNFFFWAGVFSGLIIGIYLGVLYLDLKTVFENQKALEPTRIYSDVVRITLSQSLTEVQERLRGSNYQAQGKFPYWQWDLHPADYPSHLVPEDYPRKSTVRIHFDNKSLVDSIQLGDQPVSEVFLEPKLMAVIPNQPSDTFRTPLKLEEIPSLVWQAIIAIEDQHFLDHKGLDGKGLARALWVDIKTRSLAQGGSTITQQLVKNLRLRRGKNFFLKFNEMVLAFLLEAQFTKEQILERYLNEVYLGQIGNQAIHGVAQGAEYFFDKKINQLHLGEIALLAGLIRGPHYYSPYTHLTRALQRQKLVLKKMVETGQIAPEEAQQARHLPIRLSRSQSESSFFVDTVKAKLQEYTHLSGLKVYTTMDPYWNALAQKIVTEGTLHIQKKSQLPYEGILMSVEHHTGYIRALIGGRNYTKSHFNRILNMKRQVGSLFKPIVYLTAFQQKTDTSGTIYAGGYPLEDRPWTLTYQGKKWSPKNYEKTYEGWVTLRYALSRSLNVPTARLGYLLGYQALLNTARALGITSELPEVPSLPLGSAELAPLEVLQMYSTLANRGTQMPLLTIRSIFSNGTELARFNSYPESKLDPTSVDLLNTILKDVFQEGTARQAASWGFQQPACGKTGTTSDYRDAWFAGYTGTYTTVVWVGLDHHQPSPPITGATAALPIWVTYMKNLPPSPLPEPNLIQVSIDRHTGELASPHCPPAQVLSEKYPQLPSKMTCNPYPKLPQANSKTF